MSNTKTFDGRHESYIIVTDNDGEEWVCPKSALKSKDHFTPEELSNCTAEYRTGGGASIGG